MRGGTRALAQGAIIAALYAALCLLLPAISFGPLQFRVAEALSALAMVTPVAIPGLFVGCLISNLFNGPWDVVIGSLATLISALLTWKLRKRSPGLALLPPVLVNAVMIGAMLTFAFQLPSPLLGAGEQPVGLVLLCNMATVGLGQAAACYGLGLPFYQVIKRTLPKLFL